MAALHGIPSRRALNLGVRHAVHMGLCCRHNRAVVRSARRHLVGRL